MPDRPDGPWTVALDPFNVSSVVNDPVGRELERLGVKVALPSDRLTLPGGRTLTREQETAVKQRRGQTVSRAVERLMADSRHRRLDDAGRVRPLERLIERVRGQTSAGLRRELQYGG